MSPCYCANCKTELTVSSISDEDTAGCARCRSVVEMSWFEVPSWLAGLLVVLAANAALPLV
jgi:uncharacterized paraquat-inducible protein A